MKKTFCVDIDGILTKETEGFGEEIYMSRTPNEQNIERLRTLHSSGKARIILHTSRHEEDREVTEQWLKRHNIPYNEIVFGKPKADVYVDDKAVNQIDREFLCVSGGLDSTIAFFYLNKHPQPFYCRLGHRYQRKEERALRALEKLIPEFKVMYADNLKLGRWEYGENAYIPMRNLFIIMNAILHGGTKIYLVGVKGDKVEDKSPEAFAVMSFALNFIRKKEEGRVSVHSPFWDMTKVDIVRWFLNNYPKDFVKEVLYTSVSCYDTTTNGHCGVCPSCFRKWVALEYNGLECLDLFENDIRKWDGIEGYIKRIKAGYYDAKRSKEMEVVLKKYDLWR